MSNNLYVSATVGFEIFDGEGECIDYVEYEVEPGVWWVGRVLVQRSADRCEGIGSRMLAMLCADCAKQPGFVKMLVTPGGYGSDPKRLIEFYSRAGFVLLREMPGALSWSSPSA